MAEYIKREAVLEAFENADADVYEDYGDGYVDWGFGRKNVRGVINAIPTADVAPVVHGRWVDGKCSNCGVDIPTDDAHDVIFGSECRFCYYCGARMDGGDDNEVD